MFNRKDLDKESLESLKNLKTKYEMEVSRKRKRVFADTSKAVAQNLRIYPLVKEKGIIKKIGGCLPSSLGKKNYIGIETEKNSNAVQWAQLASSHFEDVHFVPYEMNEIGEYVILDEPLFYKLEDLRLKYKKSKTSPDKWIVVMLAVGQSKESLKNAYIKKQKQKLKQKKKQSATVMNSPVDDIDVIIVDGDVSRDKSTLGDVSRDETTVTLSDVSKDETTVTLSDVSKDETIVTLSDVSRDETTVTLSDVSKDETIVTLSDVSRDKTTVTLSDVSRDKTTVTLSDVSRDKTTISLSDVTRDNTRSELKCAGEDVIQYAEEQVKKTELVMEKKKQRKETAQTRMSLLKLPAVNEQRRQVCVLFNNHVIERPFRYSDTLKDVFDWVCEKIEPEHLPVHFYLSCYAPDECKEHTCTHDYRYDCESDFKCIEDHLPQMLVVKEIDGTDPDATVTNFDEVLFDLGIGYF